MTFRIGAIFKRRPNTLWTKKEMDALKSMLNTDEADIVLIEQDYAADHGEEDIRRQDIQTLLNNWPSEVDRARAWAAKQNGQPSQSLHSTFGRFRKAGISTTNPPKREHFPRTVPLNQ